VHSPASLVGAMNAAATQDLRSAGLTPRLAALLGGSAPSSPRAGRMLDLLVDWRAAGSSRLDVDLDGKIDAGAAPAIWDALYPRLVDAVMRPVLGPQLGEYKDIVGQDNSPRSGFTGGGINVLDKDLGRVAGADFAAPYRTDFCGRGKPARCRRDVWAALDAVGAALEAAQGTADPDAWRADATAERISFAPGLLQATIRYTNRPSGIQQVMSFSGHRPQR
jgi:hypothetical protein